MLMNEKNKEMERWASVVTLLSSILFFVFVCLFVCLFVFLFEKRLCHNLRYCFLGDVQTANYDIH